MHKFKMTKGKSAWVGLKLDMEKAYDRMEWDFLFAVLKQLGFRDQWIRWIRECVTTVSYSMLINHASNGLFKPSRGLRQGDPLSPYLFILYMNVLNMAISKAANIPKSDIGVRVCPQSPLIPCLFFADDNLLFCKANTSACLNLKDIIINFCTLSGQLINFHKSSLVFSSNATRTHKQKIAAIFNIP